MSAEETKAIEAAHAALFEIDSLLANTYSPTREVLEEMHERLFQARRGLELTYGVKP